MKRLVACGLGLFVTLGLLGAALAADAARFEAETMSESAASITTVSDSAAIGSGALRFTAVGEWASKTVNLGHSAEQLEIRSRATTLGGTRPVYRIFVDGQQFANSVGDVKAAGTYTTHTFPVSLASGTHTIYIKCVAASGTADNTDGDCSNNRAVFVDWIALTYTPEIDTDSDGIPDTQDNCPTDSNAGQSNNDGDSQGDTCDPDDDNDGRDDATDYDPLDPNVQDPPPPPPGDILWTGDGENPTNTDWAQIFTKTPYCGANAQSGLAPDDHEGYHSRVSSDPAPLQGAYALKGKVDDSYECFQERTEVSQNGDPSKQFLPDGENWQAFGIWLGSDFQVEKAAQGAHLLFQHKPIPSSNPTATIVVDSGLWKWKTDGGPTDNPVTTTIGAATQQQWCKFVIHTRYEYDDTGLSELYSDVPGGCGGPIELIASRNEPTLWTATSPWGQTERIRVNMGYYRDVSYSDTETFAHDGYTVGTTKAVVEANAFPGN